MMHVNKRMILSVAAVGGLLFATATAAQANATAGAEEGSIAMSGVLRPASITSTQVRFETGAPSAMPIRWNPTGGAEQGSAAL